MKKVFFFLALTILSVAGMAQGTRGGGAQGVTGSTGVCLLRPTFSKGGSGTSGFFEGGNNGHGVELADETRVDNGIIARARYNKPVTFGGHGDPAGH